MTMTRRTFALTGAAFILGACSDISAPATGKKEPTLTFAHRAPIGLDVAGIKIERRFVATGRAPHIEHRLSNPPTVLAARWAEDRLRAQGAAGVARFIIIDAAVTEQMLKIDKSLSGMFKKQIDRAYNGRLAVRLEVQNPNGVGAAKAVVTRRQTAREDLTIDEREALLTRFVEQMGRDLDARLESEISRSLARFIR